MTCVEDLICILVAKIASLLRRTPLPPRSAWGSYDFVDPETSATALTAEYCELDRQLSLQKDKNPGQADLNAGAQQLLSIKSRLDVLTHCGASPIQSCIALHAVQR